MKKPLKERVDEFLTKNAVLSKEDDLRLLLDEAFCLLIEQEELLKGLEKTNE